MVASYADTDTGTDTDSDTDTRHRLKKQDTRHKTHLLTIRVHTRTNTVQKLSLQKREFYYLKAVLNRIGFSHLPDGNRIYAMLGKWCVA